MVVGREDEDRCAQLMKVVTFGVSLLAAIKSMELILLRQCIILQERFNFFSHLVPNEMLAQDSPPAQRRKYELDILAKQGQDDANHTKSH